MTNAPSLARSTAVMTVGTLLSRITGVGRTVAMAHAFGLFAIAEAYNQANQTPTILYELVVGGILSATLVPLFVRRFQRDEDEAWRVISIVLTLVGIAVTVLTVVVIAVAPLIIDAFTARNSGPLVGDQREMATFFLRLFAPQVAFYGFISVATAVLNARHRFGPPMFAPIFNNIVLIALFLTVPTLITNVGSANLAANRGALTLLGLGTTAGVGAMALLLVPYLRREARGRLRFRWQPRHSAVGELLRLSGWTAGFVIANQVTLATVFVLAGSETGPTTAFLTAYTFFILPHGIYVVSLMSALQPRLAAAWNNGDRDEYRRQFVRGLRLVLFGIVPAAVGYALLARPVVDAVLQHGSFTANNAELTAHVLLAMVLGLPGFSVFLFCVRALQAIQDARTVFWLYVFENVVNIAANFALFFRFGVTGLAAGQSIGYGVAALAALVIVRRRARGLDLRPLVNSLVRVAAATLAMAIAVFATQRLSLDPILGLLAAILSGAVVFLVAAWGLRVNELTTLARRRF